MQYAAQQGGWQVDGWGCGPRAVRAVLLGSLTQAHGLRYNGLDQRHVRLLVESVAKWPPILLWGSKNQVVDGAHRIAAAHELGMKSITAEWFPGSAEEAFLEAVERNATHGLPLVLEDRICAVHRILEQHPQWSDRRIAKLCGVAGTTVARVRHDKFAAEPTAFEHKMRVGRDGRVRPISSVDIRGRVRGALEQNPGASLRTLAALASVSPETVRTVRLSLQIPSHSPTDRPPTGSAVIPIDREHPHGAAPIKSEVMVDRGEEWKPDIALSTCDSADRLINWLSNSSVVYQWSDFAEEIPLSRIYEVADECRRRSQAWLAFASALEVRAKPRTAVAG
jgi:hypothetical protein